MNTELIAPTTALAIELLKREPTASMELTPEVIASAFLFAYQGLAEGIRRVDAALPPAVASVVGLHI